MFWSLRSPLPRNLSTRHDTGKSIHFLLSIKHWNDASAFKGQIRAKYLLFQSGMTNFLVLCQYLNVEFFHFKKKCLFFHCDDRQKATRGRRERRIVSCGRVGHKKKLVLLPFCSLLVLFLKSCYSLIPDDLMTVVTCVCVSVCVR